MTATRVMKARRTSTCSLCRGPIKLCQQIAKSGIWAHVECIIERAAALAER